MARDFAVIADSGVLLDLDESSDFGIVADGAAVEVDKFGKFDVLAEADIGANANEILFLDPHHNS